MGDRDRVVLDSLFTLADLGKPIRLICPGATKYKVLSIPSSHERLVVGFDEQSNTLLTVTIRILLGKHLYKCIFLLD